MANQSKELDNVPSNALASRLLKVLPVEIRLQIYGEVFHGSRARLLSVRSRNPLSMTLAFRPSHHHQLLLVCHQVYTEALSAYWSSTVIDSALNPLFESANFATVLRTIPPFARPLVREIRCKGFQEKRSIPSLGLDQFLWHFIKIEIFVMELARFYVSPSHHLESSWDAATIVERAQHELRKHFPRFGLMGFSGIQVLQRVQFFVIVRSMGRRIHSAARDEEYPGKTYFINHSKGLVAEGQIETPDEEGFQKVL